MYYTIQNGSILMAENKGVLFNYYDNVQVLPFDYEVGKYVVENNELVLNPNFEEEKAQQERERLDKLSMTRGDVFEALILARGLTKPQIRAMIEQAELDDITKALYLNRFDEALDFYRGFPVFDMLGQALGVTSEQLDNFFITKNYEFLKVVEVPAEETSGDDVADEGKTSQNEGE